MEKVRLPKVTIDAIELMKAKGTPLNEIVQRHVHGEHIQVNGYENVCELSMDTLIRALYIGYEVEMTPEERIKWAISNAGDLAPVDSDTAYVHGIKAALEIYGIKISGVNAE